MRLRTKYKVPMRDCDNSLKCMPNTKTTTDDYNRCEQQMIRK